MGGGGEKETAAPHSDSGKMMTDCVKNQEAVPPEKAPEVSPPEKMAKENCEAAPCEPGRGEAISPAPPDACSKPEPEEAESPCEKHPEQEVEPPCEKCSERQEKVPPCEKKPPEPEVSHSGQKASDAPSEPEGSPGDMGDLCWYASPDGALVCFDGVHSLIALPPKDERVPNGIPGHPRQIEGRDYLVYVTKNGRIVS